MGLSISIRKQLLASTILVAAGSIYGGLSQEASAGSCVTTDVSPALLNVSCTGIANLATDGTQTFNSAGGIIITDVATFGLNTTFTGGNGISTLTGQSEITLLGNINAQLTGIVTDVTVGGATTRVTNKGIIKSDSLRGIQSIANAGAGFINIINDTGATIDAFDAGIFSRAQSVVSPTVIRNFGTITSATDQGIYADQNAITNGSAIIVGNESTGVITAKTEGIDVRNNSANVLTDVSNRGTMTADRYGIQVIEDGVTGSVQVGNTGTITAINHGIRSHVLGTNSTTIIINEGALTSTTNRGITARTDGNSGKVTISNGATGIITGHQQGILADVQGTGAITTITNSNIIRSNTNQGIDLNADNDTGLVNVRNNASGSIDAFTDGINANLDGSGDMNISNHGEIKAKDQGIFLTTGTHNTTATILNTGDNATITAVNDGIDARINGTNAKGLIENSGKIVSSAESGAQLIGAMPSGDLKFINTELGDIEGKDDGVLVQSMGLGKIDVENGGQIKSTTMNGVDVFADQNTSTVNVSHYATGNITSTLDGIHAEVRSNIQSTNINVLGAITSSAGDGIEFVGNRFAQTNSVNIDVDHTVTATAAAGVKITETIANSANSITINAESNADITAKNGIEIHSANGTNIAINVKSGARVIGSASGIVDAGIGGIGANTKVLLEGRINGDVYLGGNDDSFTMKDAGARLAPGTAAIVDGGAGIDDFTFDNVQRLFRHNLDNFEMVELKNNSFINTRNKTFDTDEYLINPDNTHRGLGLTVIEGNVTNNGTISLADNSVNESYLMTGNLSGNGLYILDARLDATENADLVGVNGNIDPTSRNILRVNDLAGTGAATGNNDTDGILLVGVNGTSIADNFKLENGPITAGAFVYDLHHSLGDDFFLQTTGISTMGASAASAAQGSVLGADALMAGYLTRKSGRLEAPLSGGQVDSDGNSFGADLIHASEVNPANVYWLRLLGAFGDYDGRVHSGGVADILNTDADFGGAQFGIDFAMTDYPYMVASISGHYLYQDNDIFNTTQGLPVGSTTLHSYGAGLEISYDPGAGMYFDALGAFSLTDVDVNAGPNLSGDTRGNEYFLSAEIGYRYQTGYGNLSFTPEAQIYSHLGEFSDFSFSNGVPVSDVSNERTMLRLGASFDDYYEMASGNFHLTGGVSWLTALENTAEASIFNIPVDISNSDDLVEGTLGMEYSLDGSSSMWLNVTHRSGINDLDTSNTSLALGLSMKF